MSRQMSDRNMVRLAAALVDSVARDFVDSWECGEDGPLKDEVEDLLRGESSVRIVQTVIARLKQTVSFLESVLERPPLG